MFEAFVLLHLEDPSKVRELLKVEGVVEAYAVEGEYARARRVCEKCEYFKGKCKYPVLRGYFQNLVELVKVRMRVLTRRLK